MHCSLWPKNGVDAIEAVERAATAARIAFVALRKRRIVKIIATRALQKIAADRRHVAQLRTRAGKERFAQNRVTQFDQRMFRHIGIARERADANAFAAGQFFDLRERQPIDVDQLRGRLHAHLHQIDQICSAAEKFCLRLFLGERLMRITRA